MINTLKIEKESDTSYVSSSVQIYYNDTTRLISDSEMDDRVKKTYNNILRKCLASDLSGNLITKGVSQEIKKHISLENVERDSMDSLIIECFSTRDNVKAIYKYKEDEYWLIVEDAYSDATMDCYDAYFDLLEKNEKPFELRAMTEKELSGVMYMEPKVIFGEVIK